MVSDASGGRPASRHEDLQIRDILLKCRRIAILGEDAANPAEDAGSARDANPAGEAGPAGEMEFLRGVGYEVWLVDPRCEGPVDVLYVPAKSGRIERLLSEASRLGVGTVWLREEDFPLSAEEIRRQGFRWIQGRSMKEEYIAHFLSTCSA